MTQPPIKFSPGERVVDALGQAHPFFTAKLNNLLGQVPAGLQPATGHVARLTAAGGETSLAMADAVPADKDWSVLVTINSVPLDAGEDYTTDGTNVLHLTNPLNVGDRVVARHAYPY